MPARMLRETYHPSPLRRIGKSPVVLEKEISGFVANRILGALMDEAVDLYENGVSSFEDIDTA